MSNTNPILGIVIMARHGDREGFYQVESIISFNRFFLRTRIDPDTYKASDTRITPLGERQCFELGQLLRFRYGSSNSTTVIKGLTLDGVLNPNQFNVTADAGGEGGVISDSAVALFQGWFPPNLDISTITLANGTNVTSPLNGYQYIQINTVIPLNDVDFESWINCKTWTKQTDLFYNSTEFLKVENDNQMFLNSLKPLVGGQRQVDLESIWNVFDYMNVQSIHNSTFANLLNETGSDVLAKVRDLANYHEWGSFTSANLSGIGNIAGRTFLPRVIDSLRAFTQDSTVKVAHYHMSYKQMASAPGFDNADAIVDYASAVVFELRQNSALTGYDVRMGFKNGTIDTDFKYYPMFGSDSVDFDFDQFASNLEPHLLPNTTTWCHECQNTIDSGCDVVALADKYQTLTTELQSKSHFSPVGAGFIGVAVTLVVGILVLGLMRMFGIVSFGRTNQKRTRNNSYPLSKTDSISSTTPL
ncbi:hypothetical protein OIO90_006369 [Microbotryomycetes sp. JL221]|nr:hypothetical protein OIO90_006369 [Microbotryomycetes sp. JL221]